MNLFMHELIFGRNYIFLVVIRRTVNLMIHSQIESRIARDYPVNQLPTGSLWATSQTTEMAQNRLETIHNFLNYVQLPENEDIR